ncbi:MAG: FmdB family zinc ribbon protein [Syntrophobacteraceae bacterium]
MPLYEYQCDTCGHRFERLVFHDEENVGCPSCSGEVRKLMSPFAIEIPDELCGKLPRGEKRELCTECREGGSSCPLAA